MLQIHYICINAHGYWHPPTFISAFTTYLRWNILHFSKNFFQLWSSQFESQSMATWESQNTSSAVLIWLLIFRHILKLPKNCHLTFIYCVRNIAVFPSFISCQLNDRLSILCFAKYHGSAWNNNKSRFLFSPHGQTADGWPAACAVRW